MGRQTGWMPTTGARTDDLEYCGYVHPIMSPSGIYIPEEMFALAPGVFQEITAPSY